MTAETNYFWLNCGYNRWNHNEPLVGQTAYLNQAHILTHLKDLERLKRLK